MRLEMPDHELGQRKLEQVDLLVRRRQGLQQFGETLELILRHAPQRADSQVGDGQLGAGIERCHVGAQLEGGLGHLFAEEFVHLAKLLFLHRPVLRVEQQREHQRAGVVRVVGGSTHRLG